MKQSLMRYLFFADIRYSFRGCPPERDASVRRSLLRSVFAEATAAKHSSFVVEILRFLWDLQAKTTADERTRTAYPCSLRVCGQWLLGVAEVCNYRVDKRFSVPCIAHYCRPLRAG
jgi:hypothetical protein